MYTYENTKKARYSVVTLVLYITLYNMMMVALEHITGEIFGFGTFFMKIILST